MAYELNVNGIMVKCDTLQEFLAIASTMGMATPPATPPATQAPPQATQAPPQATQAPPQASPVYLGQTAQPQPAQDQVVVVLPASGQPGAAFGVGNRDGSCPGRGFGPKQSWVDAEKYMEANPGITKNEARLIISKMKKEARAQAILEHMKRRKELGI
jgi:hypothetical protein